VHPDQLELPLRWKKPRIVLVNSMSDLFHPSVLTAFIKDVFSVMAQTRRHTYRVLTMRSKRLLQLSDQLNWSPNIWMGVHR
jgi:protein gp37